MPLPIQRSAMSGVYCGTFAGVGVGLTGGLLATPLIGLGVGVGGLLFGSAVGDRATSGRRRLTAEELNYAREIYRDSVDLERIVITRDSMVSLGAPKGTGYVIHLKSDWSHFDGDATVLSRRGLEVLIHEIGHVWQYENGGLAYMHRSLWVQFVAWRKHGTRNAAYNWLEAHEAGLPWEKWNPEQQATAIEDYNISLRRVQEQQPEYGDPAQIELLTPYMQFVWDRFGAPRFFR